MSINLSLNQYNNKMPSQNDTIYDLTYIIIMVSLLWTYLLSIINHIS